jgi:hypothetical protein
LIKLVFCEQLKSTEFLNLDAILESVMHKLVVRPLKEHLYQLFVEEYTRTGAIQLLADNIQYARTKPMHELGVRARIAPPSEEALETICRLLTALQEVDSPLDKLESLLACIGTIFNSVWLLCESIFGLCYNTVCEIPSKMLSQIPKYELKE